MPELRTVIKLSVTDAERETLDRTAYALGIARSELIRARAMQERLDAPLIPKGLSVYPAAVEAAAKAAGGLSRVQLEPIVAAVILSLHANAPVADA
jgi:hypothetical protein